MRRKLVLLLVLLNCALGMAILTRSAESQIIPRGIFDCCEGGGPEAYCCFGCCWFVRNCVGSQDCGIEKSEPLS